MRRSRIHFHRDPSVQAAVTDETLSCPSFGKMRIHFNFMRGSVVY